MGHNTDNFTWRKSSYSGSNGGDCVEIADNAGGAPCGTPRILAGRCWLSGRMSGGRSRLRSRWASSTWPEAQDLRRGKQSAVGTVRGDTVPWAARARTLSIVPPLPPLPSGSSQTPGLGRDGCADPDPGSAGGAARAR